MQLQNIKDLRTTLPTIISSVVTILVMTGVLNESVSQDWQAALIGLSLSLLTVVGLFSKGK